MARSTRTSQRAAEEAALAAPPPSASQFNSPESLSTQTRLRESAMPRSPTPQDENQNENQDENASSSAPRLSVQFANSAIDIGPKTPPRASFRRPGTPFRRPATGTKKMGDLMTPPSSQPSPVSDVDENTAPGGRREHPANYNPLLRRYREDPELTDIDAVYWESNFKVLQAAEEPRPKEWERDVIFYQRNGWETDTEEYPPEARFLGVTEQPLQDLTMKNPPKPDEGHKVKLTKDLVEGQIWMGVKTPVKASSASKRPEIKVMVSRFPDSDNTSDEDENENENGRGEGKQRQRVDENGKLVPNDDIDPTTGLPTGDWLTGQIEMMVDQCDMARREWDVVDRDMSSLYGDIMREKDSIEEENLEEGEMWDILHVVVDPTFLGRVKRSAVGSHEVGEVLRLPEPFLGGEPEEESVHSDEEVETDGEDGHGGGGPHGPGGGSGGHGPGGGPRRPGGGGGYSGPGEDDSDNESGPDGGLGGPEGNHSPEVDDNDEDNGANPASEGTGEIYDEDENGADPASDDMYEVDTAPYFASDDSGDLYVEIEGQFDAALARFDADARARENASDFYGEDEYENDFDPASDGLCEIGAEDDDETQATSDGAGDTDAEGAAGDTDPEDDESDTDEENDNPRALRRGRRLEGVDELAEELNNRENRYTDIPFPPTVNGAPRNPEPWMMFRGAGHRALVQRALDETRGTTTRRSAYGIQAIHDNLFPPSPLCETEEDREDEEEQESDEDQQNDRLQVNVAVGIRTYQVYRDNESEEDGEYVEPGSSSEEGPQNVPGTLPNGDPEGFEDFWSDTEGIYIPDPNRVYTVSEDEEEHQSGDETREEPSEDAGEEVRRAPLVDYESDEESDDEAHHADAEKSDSEDEERKTTERRPFMPKSILKRPRGSGDDDSSENDSDDENQAPRRPMKKRRISGRYGASNENASVDPASPAENDQNSLDESDESSSENRRLSTIIERPSSEDRAEEADVLDMLSAANSRTPSTSPGPSLEPDASLDFYDFQPSRTPSPAPSKIFDSDSEDVEMTDDTDDPESDATQPNSDRADDSSDEESSDEDDAAANVPVPAATTSAALALAPVPASTNPTPGPAGPSAPVTLVATAQNPRPLRRHETLIVGDTVYRPEPRDGGR